MIDLPRLLAFTDDRIGALPDLDRRAAAISQAGAQVALVARLPAATTDALATLALRFVSVSADAGAGVFVTGRADVAVATGAHGVILRDSDLPVRALTWTGQGPAGRRFWRLRSVHSEAEAVQAVADGADALIAGTIWASPTHPERTPAGTGFLSRVAALGVPAYAIGGITLETARQAASAGAFGVAAIRSVWDAADPAGTVKEMVAPWN
ncbi:MAG TPA: thiamine phosphate synthase [Gemmatimonadales bacterium]